MTLIFNVREEDIALHTFAVGLVGEAASDIAACHQGERVVLGISGPAGVRLAIGLGTLASHWSRKHVTYIVITEVVALPESLELIARPDASGESYGMDMLDASDADRILGLPNTHEQANTPRLSAAEDMPAFDLMGRDQDDSTESNLNLIHKVTQAYHERCTFTGIKQFSLDRRLREGVAIRVDSKPNGVNFSVSQYLFMSRTVAFCYRNGLLAIGEDYDILRHRDLCAEIRMLLETVNRKAMLLLPKDESDWPDLDAARRHRQRFGY
ncbi:hypothetical protein [Pelagibacterium mangrovi]|uniref:hypothetical protein n=1 Tax=Pelagibacterium mangrovi TaxID=3119828 RepID=UPI002FC959C2